jgi:hypothetical protein
MSQVNAHAVGTSARTGRQRWYALAVCMAGGFIVFLDVSIVNVALPRISRQLHASGSLLQWIVAGYSLPFADHRPECVASGSLNGAGEASTLSRWGRPAGDWS